MLSGVTSWKAVTKRTDDFQIEAGLGVGDERDGELVDARVAGEGAAAEEGSSR
jgi:hypothetical protein